MRFSQMEPSTPPLEIPIQAEVCAVNSCVSELREHGAEIHCRQIRSQSGDRLWLYRMTSPASKEHQ